MSLVLSILYNVIIMPVIFVIEFAYSVILDAVLHPGWAIVGVSLVVNVLCTPLYAMADAKQQEERDRQAAMAKWVDHIKKHFKGDEQYMMLTTYYRQCGYKQIYAFSSSISLLLQIPIFIAAYHFLSGLASLKGTPFLFISDLGAPDALLTICGFTINFLPVLMTLLNCISTSVYTRGFPLRDKLQAYGLALVFLVLLYRSPAGLVMYWTCNQVFSLIKNIVSKANIDERMWRIVSIVFAELLVVACLGYGFSSGLLSTSTSVAVTFVAVVLVEYYVWSVLMGRGKTLASIVDRGPAKSTVATFLLTALLAGTLLGALIPSALIADSPSEFVSIANLESPLCYVRYTACVYLGLFVVWVGTYFFLFKGEARTSLAFCLWVICLAFLIDYLFFGKDLGIINTNLVYAELPEYSIDELVRNAAALAALIVGSVLVWRYARSIVAPATAILLISVVALTVPNFVTIEDAFKETLASIGTSAGNGSDGDVQEGGDTLQAVTSAGDEEESDVFVTSKNPSVSPKSLFKEDGSINPLITLSKEGRNVIVFFLDRAIGSYVPYVMNEKPELANQFAGFTYYANTTSFGMWTMVGAPALAGGYEYTPTRLGERSDMLLRNKHDEALKVLPKIFSENGFSTTILNPPLVNYNFDAVDFTTFEDIEGVEVYRITGAYTDMTVDADAEVFEKNRYRSFVFYSLFKALPVAVQPALYDEGAYFSTIANHALSSGYLDEYATIANLDALTQVEDGNSDNYLFMQTEATHEPDLLQQPNYVSSPYVDNHPFFDESLYTLNGRTVDMDVNGGFEHYCVNMATYMQLGAWFDYLREQGVYDNTRIILVSDHGYAKGQFEDFLLNDYVDVESVNCVLMVKDFNSTEPFAISQEFMTNADTPTLALAGIVENPVNPYTGNAISSEAKYAGPQEVYFTVVWDSNTHREETAFDFGDGFLYTVNGNIFDKNSWVQLSEPTTSADWR